MKAEHRKELETNALADWIGRCLQSGKTASKNTYVVGALALLIAAGIVAYFVIRNASGKAHSERWYNLDKAGTIAELDKLAGENRGTMVARAARFEVARALLAQGVQNLANPDQHASAVESLEKARSLYEELAPQAKDTPVLQQEALMGVATAEESLVGSSKDASLDKAMEYYQRVADQFPDTFQGNAARKRAELLKDPKTRAEIEKFYVSLNQRISKGG
jgi:hypothetical protein